MRSATKIDLTAAVLVATELPRDAAQSVVEAILNAITESLQHGESVRVKGFGTFSIRVRKPRTGRNPKTGEKVRVPAKKIAFFRPALELKRLLVRLIS